MSTSQCVTNTVLLIDTLGGIVHQPRAAVQPLVNPFIVNSLRNVMSPIIAFNIFETLISSVVKIESNISHRENTSFTFIKTLNINKPAVFLVIILLNCVSMECLPLPEEDPATARGRRFIERFSLEEGQTASLCQYDVHLDTMDNRIPRNIIRVVCKEEGCGCHGAFSCTQLWHAMEVQVDGQPQPLEVQYGCVCAAKYSTLIAENKVDTVS